MPKSEFKAPDTPIIDVVVLVTDRESPRYGQLGKIRGYDWTEYGIYDVEFKDGKREQYPDGIDTKSKTLDGEKVHKSEPCPMKQFYKGNDSEKEKEWRDCGKSINDLKATYLEMDLGSIRRLRGEYRELFGEDLP